MRQLPLAISRMPARGIICRAVTPGLPELYLQRLRPLAPAGAGQKGSYKLNHDFTKLKTLLSEFHALDTNSDKYVESGLMTAQEYQDWKAAQEVEVSARAAGREAE